ncbi:unnamed protein product [Cuscuta campestris]|uniref:Uncharacterized protein n=1 Tax=Cuscuta campestris TaxID=132261 RepID=A0A484N453_9ASTE|nr:unnamed protein product [Cuscuta campestris]
MELKQAKSVTPVATRHAEALRGWQKGSILRNLVSQSTKIGAVTESLAAYSAFFHSTPFYLEKRKNNWGSVSSLLSLDTKR